MAAMHTSMLEGSTFISVISPADGGSKTISAAEAWIKNNRIEVEKQLKKGGALLFRGFDVTDPMDFERIALATNPNLADRYPGGAPRAKLAPHVWTASETPGKMPISSHCELSYIPKLRPDQIYFCCLHAAEKGGETPVANMHDVWKSLPQDLQDRIASNNFEVVRQYPESKRRMLDVRRIAGPTTAWPDVLGSNEAARVISDAEKDGVTLTFWKSGKRPPVLSMTKSGNTFWARVMHIVNIIVSFLLAVVDMFNHWPLVEMQEKVSNPEKVSDACVELVTSFSGCRTIDEKQAYAGIDMFFSEYGWAVEAAYVALHTQRLVHAWVAFKIVVGTVIFMLLRKLGFLGRPPLDIRVQGRSLSLREVIQIERAFWSNFEFHKWQAGDVMVLDNGRCSHGRMPFEGKRTVLTAFG